MYMSTANVAFVDAGVCDRMNFTTLRVREIEAALRLRAAAAPAPAGLRDVELELR